MTAVFYVSAAIAIIATVRAVTGLNAVRSILYLIVSFLALAVIFYDLGAPFAAALEVITYAGAIMVLFIFITLFLNLGPLSAQQEKNWLSGRIWIGPLLLAAALLGAMVYGFFFAGPAARVSTTIVVVEPRQVGAALLGRYTVGVELASMLLLGGLLGAYHLAKPRSDNLEGRKP